MFKANKNIAMWSKLGQGGLYVRVRVSVESRQKINHPVQKAGTRSTQPSLAGHKKSTRRTTRQQGVCLSRTRRAGETTPCTYGKHRAIHYRSSRSAKNKNGKASSSLTGGLIQPQNCQFSGIMIPKRKVICYSCIKRHFKRVQK